MSASIDSTASSGLERSSSSPVANNQKRQIVSVPFIQQFDGMS